jgi:hypothetical protein
MALVVFAVPHERDGAPECMPRLVLARAADGPLRFSLSSIGSATNSAEVSKLTTMALSRPWWTTLSMKRNAGCE